MADEPTWLNAQILEALHADQIIEHGGSPGIRDQGLLKYAAYIEQCEQVYTCSEDEMGDTTGETGA